MRQRDRSKFISPKNQALETACGMLLKGHTTSPKHITEKKCHEPRRTSQ